MKKFLFCLVLSASLFAINACKPRSTFDDKPITEIQSIEIKDLAPPKDFNFETHKDVYVRALVQNPATPSTRYLIKIYSNLPATGQLVASGLTNAQHEFATTIRVPAGQEFLWLEKVNPDGSSYYEKVKATTFVSSVLNSGPSNVHIFKKSGSGMNCTSSCYNSYNNNNGNLSLSGNNKTYCITGTYSGNLTVANKTTVKICATGSINTLTINGSGKVYILEAAELTIGSLVTNSTNCKVKNWSDSLVVSGSTTLNGDLENYGKMYVDGALTTNSGSYIYNYGVFDVAGSMTVNKDIKNYEYMHVDGALTLNSNANFWNYCHLEVDGDMDYSGDMYCKSYIKVGGKLTVNSSDDFELEYGAMLSVKDLTLNDKIYGKGLYTSVVKVTGTTTINSNGEFKGKLDICDVDGVETNNGTISSPAQLDCSGYIATSTCNPEGFGGASVLDDDGDGVVNLLDAYPNDADRAFDSYFPSATTMANFAVEDLWPNTGDFDFNDMVIAFNLHKVLDADNKVVDLKMKVNVRAVGGSFDNGFGISFDEVAANDIDSVTGQVLVRSIISNNSNNTEAGQNNAVVICFDTPEPSLHRATGSFFNSIKENPKGTSDTMYINVSFGTHQTAGKLDIENINPFIFTNQRRGYEVHLGDFAPTALANTSLFGTGQDASNPQAGTYYKTAHGLPWAILLLETFEYPKEKAPVNQAHLYFNEWALSGGTQRVGWYQNLAQYRDDNLIFE